MAPRSERRARESARTNVRPEGVFISGCHLPVKRVQRHTPRCHLSGPACRRGAPSSVAPRVRARTCAYCRCVTRSLPVLSGTFVFPFPTLLGCGGNKYSFVCGSAGPCILKKKKKKTALKAYKVFLQDGKKKKREKLPEWKFGVIFVTTFSCLS